MEVNTITSECNVKFIVAKVNNDVYIASCHHTSYIGQLDVYDLMDKLGLQENNKFLKLRDLNSNSTKTFISNGFSLGNHSIEEVEDVIRNFSEAM